MEVKQYDLQAGLRTQIAGTWKFFMLITTGAPLTVEFLKNGSPTRETGTNVEAGYVSKPGDWRNPDDRFDGFVLTSATAQTVTLGVSNREGDYRRALALVQIDQPNGITDAADQPLVAAAAAIVVAAANGNRRSVTVQNVGANPVRVGGSTIDNTHGLVLQVNGSRTFVGIGDIYAFSQLGSTVAVQEETKT